MKRGEGRGGTLGVYCSIHGEGRVHFFCLGCCVTAASVTACRDWRLRTAPTLAAQISFLGPLPSASRGDPLSSPIPARPPQLPPPPLLPSVWSEMSLDSLSPPSLPSTFLGSRRRRGPLDFRNTKESGGLGFLHQVREEGCSSVCQTCSRTYVRTTCMEKGGRTKKPLWYARLIAQSLIAIRLPYRPSTTRGIFCPTPL